MYSVALVAVDDCSSRSRLLRNLDEAGVGVEVVDADGRNSRALAALPDVVIVGRVSGQLAEDMVLRLTPFVRGSVPIILERGALGSAAAAACIVVEDLMSPDLPALLQACARHHRLITQAKLDSERQVAAVGMIQRGTFKFRTLGEARSLATLLATVCPDSDRVAIGVGELLVNAVEHGNLGITYEEKSALLAAGDWDSEVERRLAVMPYASRIVVVEFKRGPEFYSFDIQDEGAGFDPTAFLAFNPSRLRELHGRGIAIACKMGFDRVTYHGKGNHVVAEIRVDVASTGQS